MSITFDKDIKKKFWPAANLWMV